MCTVSALSIYEYQYQTSSCSQVSRLFLFLQAALDALEQKRTPLMPSELEAIIGFPVDSGTPLADALKGHEKVEVASSGEYCYKVQIS